MEKNSIEKKSEEVLKKSGYLNGQVDVIKIAQSLGFLVGITPLGDEEDGFIVVDDNFDTIERMVGIRTNKVIGVNSERDLKTKRFIIAHELGHYNLHYETEESDGMYAHRENKKGKNENENAADYFAACLLMPKQVFKNKYDEFSSKKLSLDEILVLMENYFNVPKESVDRRLKEVIGA